MEGGGKRNQRVYREARGSDWWSAAWLRPAGLSRDVSVDQLCARDEELSVGQASAADRIWQGRAASEGARKASVPVRGGSVGGAGEVSGGGGGEQGRGGAGDRGAGKDSGRAGMRAELCRAVPDLRGVSEPDTAQVGVGAAPAQ